jgi:hypothetical protein
VKRKSRRDYRAFGAMLPVLILVVESSTVRKRVGREWRRTELVIATDQGRRDGGAFVMAQYERGRISFQMMADVARERGSINRNTNQFMTTHHSNECPTMELPVAIA